MTEKTLKTCQSLLSHLSVHNKDDFVRILRGGGSGSLLSCQGTPLVHLRTVLKHGRPVLTVVLFHPVSVDLEGGPVDHLPEGFNPVGVEPGGMQGQRLRRQLEAFQADQKPDTDDGFSAELGRTYFI